MSDKIIITDAALNKRVTTMFEQLEALYPEHKVFAFDSIASSLRERFSKTSKDIGYESLSDMLNAYGFELISFDEAKQIRQRVIYAPGDESPVFKNKVDSVLKRLEEYYPTKKIEKSILAEHNKLGQSISGVYLWLGYADIGSFLTAYGYEYNPQSGGRPKSTNADEIISLLKERSAGATYYSLDELKEANPDIAGKFKTLSNRSKELFGMPFGEYLIQEGIIVVKPKKEDPYADRIRPRIKDTTISPQAVTILNERFKDNNEQKMAKINGKKKTKGFMKTLAAARDQIDEENEHLFIDEDSVYEVLEDGTYKLLKNFYTGKGKVLILEGTSIIGKSAFEEHKNFAKLEFPKSLRIIEESAFKCTALKTLVVPDYVVSIGARAFGYCNKLKSVTLSPNLESIASDAFEGCWELEKIKTDGKKKAFTFRDGVITKISSGKTGGSSSVSTLQYAWMNGKIFVHTGLSEEDGIRFEDIIAENGGDVRSSTVLDTDYLVYNEDYDHETKKLRRARELKDQGKDIQIITYEEWLDMLEGGVLPSDGSVSEKNEGSEAIAKAALEAAKQFEYLITDTEAILVRLVAGEGIKKVVVPAVVEGKPVKTVRSSLFENVSWGSMLEEIVFSEGIQRIEGQVLLLEDLKKVVFPASVNYISPNVFAQEDGECKDYFLSSKTVYVAPAGSYADKFLRDYKPDLCYYLDQCGSNMLTVLNDEEAATDKLKMLAAFDFEPGDDGIVATFKNRWSLDDFKEKNVTLPSEINGKTVEIFNLYGIPNFVQKIIVPATITSFLSMEYKHLFYSSDSVLDKIEIVEDNPMFWSDGYSVFSKDKKTLLRFLSFKLKEYVIPEGTETIGRFAFGGMENLAKLELPKSIKKIDSHAFYDCEKLADIQGIELVSEVGENIFKSTLYEKNATVIILGSTILKYNDLSEKVIRIPDGITRIGESAFGWKNDNDNVEEIILPSSVTEIEYAAFFGRKKLKKVNIPEGVKEIPESVFSYCEQLEVINIPASVEKIAIGAFPTDSYSEELPCALRAIEVDPANKHYCSVNGMLLIADKSELLFIPNVVQGTRFEIPDGVKKISDHLATDNEALVELILPASVTEIQERAFARCGNLKKVVFPEGLETIGAYAFSDCKKLKTIVWPKSLKSIGDSAFDESGLEELILPDTVEHIGSEAFAKTSIEKVVLPRSVRTLGWGAFSCVPEIEVYDSIDPEAGDASEGIDTINGNPNSMVGYIGMGPAWGKWQCAATHRWVNYTIVVRSAETDEIKYKVWMGADGSQRDYYCFLSSGWGHNATFAFDRLDEFFPKIRGKDNKLQVAQYRLEYPYELSETAKVKYEAYVKKNS